MTETKKREALKAAGKQRLARYGMEQFLREVSTKCAPGSRMPEPAIASIFSCFLM
jgi:hypothetical protein